MTYKLKNANYVPPARLRAGASWHNQKVKLITHLFGKEYYWLEDGDGTLWLAKVGDDGNPVLV